MMGRPMDANTGPSTATPLGTSLTATQTSASERTIVARRAGVVAVGTLASRVLGMLRMSAWAASFPVVATDVFLIAFTIPNTLRMLLGEGAASNAFVPVYTEVRTREGEAAARAFLARFTGTLFLLLLGTCALGVLAAPLIATAYAGGFLDDPQRFALVVSLTRWLFPFLLLAGLSALAAAALNVLGHYAVPAFAPAMLNLAMIAAPFTLVAFSEQLGLPPIGALALGALIGGVLQLLVQLGPLASRRMLSWPSLGFGDPHVRRALRLMAPLLLGLGVYQLNMLLSRLFASFLPAGSQSYLSYGQLVVEVPQGMFALALSAAALPTLARLRSEGKREDLLSLFGYSLRLTLFIALPSGVALFATAEPIAAVLFGRGAFGPEHVQETARSLAFQGLGVWSVACVRAVIPMFSAHQDTRTPVKASAVNLVFFVGLSVALMGPLEHVALAIANSTAAAIQVIVLLWWLRRRIGPLGLRAVARSVSRIGLASLAMAVVLHLSSRAFNWTRDVGELPRAGQLLFVLGAGGVTFLVVARACGAPELSELLQAVQRRRRRAT